MKQLLDIPKKEWVSDSECVVKCRKYAQSKYLQTWCGPVISVISIGTGIYYSVECQGQYGILDVSDTLELLLRFAYSDVKSVSEFTGNNSMDELYEKVKTLYKKNEDIITSYTKIFNSIKHLSKLDLETKSIFALGKLFGPDGLILTNYDFVMSKLYNPNEISTNVELRDVVFAKQFDPKIPVVKVNPTPDDFKSSPNFVISSMLGIKMQPGKNTKNIKWSMGVVDGKAFLIADDKFAIAEVPKSKIMAVALNLLMWSRGL